MIRSVARIEVDQSAYRLVSIVSAEQRVKITIRTYKIDQIQVKYLLNTIPRQHAHTEIRKPTTDQRQYI